MGCWAARPSPGQLWQSALHVAQLWRSALHVAQLWQSALHVAQLWRSAPARGSALAECPCTWLSPLWRGGGGSSMGRLARPVWREGGTPERSAKCAATGQALAACPASVQVLRPGGGLLLGGKGAPGGPCEMLRRRRGGRRCWQGGRCCWPGCCWQGCCWQDGRRVACCVACCQTYFSGHSGSVWFSVAQKQAGKSTAGGKGII